MANEVKELNLDDILTLIQGQLLEYMNVDGNYERFKDLNIVLSKEQQFIKLKDKDPKTMYIVVRFGSAEVTFGQTVLPATIVALAPQNNLDIAQTLFYEYAQKYNLQRAVNDTVNQVYESPQILENFNAVYEGYRSIISMSAAFVIGTNSNEYKVYYYYTEDEVEYADEVPQISASFAFVGNPDTQAFYNSNDFTRSVIGFGGVTIGFSTFILTDNRLINDILDVLGTTPTESNKFAYILNDDTKKYITDLDIKTSADVANYITTNKIAAPYDNMSVICSKTDMVWTFDGEEWESAEIKKVPTENIYESGNTVNKRFKLGIVFRDGKHARVADYRLTNMTSSQELGQIPVIALAFVE